jgi:hypothetical protein
MQEMLSTSPILLGSMINRHQSASTPINDEQSQQQQQQQKQHHQQQQQPQQHSEASHKEQSIIATDPSSLTSATRQHQQLARTESIFSTVSNSLHLNEQRPNANINWRTSSISAATTAAAVLLGSSKSPSPVGASSISEASSSSASSLSASYYANSHAQYESSMNLQQQHQQQHANRFSSSLFATLGNLSSNESTSHGSLNYNYQQHNQQQKINCLSNPSDSDSYKATTLSPSPLATQSLISHYNQNHNSQLNGSISSENRLSQPSSIVGSLLASSGAHNTGSNASSFAANMAYNYYSAALANINRGELTGASGMIYTQLPSIQCSNTQASSHSAAHGSHHGSNYTNEKLQSVGSLSPLSKAATSTELTCSKNEQEHGSSACSALSFSSNNKYIKVESSSIETTNSSSLINYQPLPGATIGSCASSSSISMPSSNSSSFTSSPISSSSSGSKPSSSLSPKNATADLTTNSGSTSAADLALGLPYSSLLNTHNQSNIRLPHLLHDYNNQSASLESHSHAASSTSLDALGSSIKHTNPIMIQSNNNSTLMNRPIPATVAPAASGATGSAASSVNSSASPSSFGLNAANMASNSSNPSVGVFAIHSHASSAESFEWMKPTKSQSNGNHSY